MLCALFACLFLVPVSACVYVTAHLCFVSFAVAPKLIEAMISNLRAIFNPADKKQLESWLQEPPTINTIETLPSTSSSICLRGWISVRIGQTAPFLWQLEWCVLSPPFLLCFQSNANRAHMSRVVYLPMSQRIQILAQTNLDAARRPFVLSVESSLGYSDVEDDPNLDFVAGTTLGAVVMTRERTFLSFETSEEMCKWKLALERVAVRHCSLSRVSFGEPSRVEHLIHLNELRSQQSTPSTSPSRQGSPSIAPLKENFGVELLSEEIRKWLLTQGFSEDELRMYDAQMLMASAKIAQGSSDRVGPKCRLKQFQKDAKRRRTLEEFLTPGTVEQHYANFKLLDSGSQGQVFKATRRVDGLDVAVKKVVLKNERTELPALINEMAVLSACDHLNVVKLFSCHRDGKELSIVMELMGGGKLTDLLDEDEGGVVFSEREIATIMREVVLGLQYLHKDGFMHRDIKSDNILVNQNGEVKLGDFGFATCMYAAGGGAVRKTLVGTPYWMAPEIARGDVYDFKADVWSVGILFLELCDGLPPWMGVNPMRALVKISTQPPPRISGKKRVLSSVAHDFAAFVLVKDPAARPSCSELLDHPFLDKSNCFNDSRFLGTYVASLRSKKKK